MEVNPPQKPAPVNKSARVSKQTATIKIGSPEIRIGLDGATKSSNMIGDEMLKPSFPKKTTMNTTGFKGLVHSPKMPKVKNPSLIKRNRKKSV